MRTPLLTRGRIDAHWFIDYWHRRLTRPGLDIADAARAVVDDRRVPLDVTWWHPYRLLPEDKHIWEAGKRDGYGPPLPMSPGDFSRLAEQMRLILSAPFDERVLAQQLRMAERFPAS